MKRVTQSRFLLDSSEMSLTKHSAGWPAELCSTLLSWDDKHPPPRALRDLPCPTATDSSYRFFHETVVLSVTTVPVRWAGFSKSRIPSLLPLTDSRHRTRQ